MTIRTAVLALLALVIAGCTTSRTIRFGSTLDTPSVSVSAPLQIVRDVIANSAENRGTAVSLVGDGLVLERPLDASSASVVAACGPHRSGRTVRVVLRTRPLGATQTALSEERYIVDRGQACRLPLDSADYSQALDALGRIKIQAEGLAARLRTAEAR